MSEELFRHRGVHVVVDTTQTADFDIQLYEVPDATVARIVRSLTDAVHVSSDRAVGALLIREMDGFDVVFLVGREEADIVVTIGRIMPVDPENPTEVILRNLNIIAILRGSTGL